MIYPIGGNTVVTQGFRPASNPSHGGVDIAPRDGVSKPPLYAVASGVITARSFHAVGGNLVVLKGDDGWFYYYGHLDSFAVTLGQRVQAGQVLGTTGRTGTSASGIHVHFEVRRTQLGDQVEPLAHLSKGDEEMVKTEDEAAELVRGVFRREPFPAEITDMKGRYWKERIVYLRTSEEGKIGEARINTYQALEAQLATANKKLAATQKELDELKAQAAATYEEVQETLYKKKG